MAKFDLNELVETLVDQAHTIRRQTDEIERLAKENERLRAAQAATQQEEVTDAPSD